MNTEQYIKEQIKLLKKQLSTANQKDKYLIGYIDGCIETYENIVKKLEEEE